MANAPFNMRASHSATARIELPAVGRVKRAAFTLVELLVVIAIIGALIAILLPALAAAKDQARRVACGSNLHQIYLAAIMYMHDNNNWLPEPAKANPTLPPGDLPGQIQHPNWCWGNGWCIENLVSNNYWSVADNPTGWWQLVEKPNHRYLSRNALRCPAMQPMEWNAWDGAVSAIDGSWPGSYVIDYDYRFNNCDSSYYVITDADSQYHRGMLSKKPYAALFHDGAGYRLGPYNSDRIIPNVGSDITRGVDQFQWAHKTGGNVVRFDGAVIWVPNKIDVTTGMFYGNALSWPSGGAVIFYNYYGYGLDETMRQFK